MWVLLLLPTSYVQAVAGDLALPGPDARDLGDRRLARPAPWIFAALVLANPVASHDLWLGQPALLAACGLLLVFAGERSGRSLVSGAGLALATIKPQLSILILFYLVLERRWRALAMAALIGLALSLVPLAVFGPRPLLASYVERLRTHTSWKGNLPGSEPSIGLRSLLWARRPRARLEPSALGLTAVVWRLRAHLRREDSFALLLGLTLLFVFNQDSAYVLVVPLLGALWFHARGRPRVTAALVALGALFVLLHALVRLAESPVLNQWRTLVTAAFVALLVFAILDARRTDARPTRT